MLDAAKIDQQASPPATDDRNDTSGLHAWTVVLLLTAIQVVSYLDRFLPSLLLQPIKLSLGLTDFQVGLLLGPAFAVFYVFVGVPLGWLADHYSRRGILAFGITIWCTMTAAAAAAFSFIPLFICRLGVGLGEATVGPCAVSIISDLFEQRKRARALSIFMAGSFIGAGSAFLFGGPLVHFLASMPPLFPGMLPWQTAFLVIGPIGYLLALSMMFIREPKRREIMPDASGRVDGSLLGALHYMRTRWRGFGALFVGSGCVVTLGATTLWNVALFNRVWGWDVSMVGSATGVLYFTGGPLGTVLGIFLTQYFIKQGYPSPTLRVLLIGLMLSVPGFALFPIMPDVGFALAGLFLAFTGQAMATAAGPASLMYLVPGQIRSQATAIYYLVIGVMGQILGPPPVGWMADLFGDPKALRFAISIEVICVGIPAITLVYLGLTAFSRHAAEIGGTAQHE
jgi:MFS family permease